MRIIHIIPGLDEPTNGIAVAARRVAAEQTALGHEVRCAGTARTDYAWADAVFVHSMWRPLEWLACWRAKRAGKTVVRMPHGCLDPRKVAYHRAKKALVLPVERFCFKFLCDRVWATCAAEARWMRGWSEAVTTVPLGVDTPPDRGDSPHEPGGDCPHEPGGDCPQALKVLFIGRMHPLKGLDALLAAVEATPCVELTVIGHDEKRLRAGFEDWCRRHELAGRVRFLGVVDERTKAAEIDRCDVFCLPTLSENFGIVIGEAMSRCRPVITTDGAPVWEDMPGDCGWYLRGFVEAAPAERAALLRTALGAAADRAQDLPERGRRAALWVRENFNWRTNVLAFMRTLPRER